MEGHVNTPSEVLQSPKDMCRKRPAPEGSRSLSATAPNGSPAVETSEKKISYSSFRHDKGDVEMHSPYNKMPSHFSTCFSKPECAELPRKLARAFGHTAHQPGTRKHQRDALGPCRVCPQHSRPMTEAYRALRLQVPSTLILKAWIEEGEAGPSHPRGRPKPALHDACCCSGPRACSGNQGHQCLPLSEHQCLNSLCAHVPSIDSRRPKAGKQRSTVPCALDAF